MSSLPKYPFDPERYIGTISEIGPTTARVNLPRAAEPSGQWSHGYHLGAGEVGEFVFIECGDRAVFGRLIYVKLPERERLSVEAEVGKEREAHPVGTIQLLTTLLLKSGTVVGGLSIFPRLGSKVYSAHPLLIKWVAEVTQTTKEIPNPIVLEFGTVPSADNTAVHLIPERLFGRHSAVLGATGGGKSWTVARLLEQCAKHRSKLVLLDATGEFHTLDGGVTHLQIGAGDPLPPSCKSIALPSNELLEADLFAMFQPGGQVQGPRFKAAMRSLKLAKLLGEKHKLVRSGTIPKCGVPKAAYDAAYSEHSKAVDSPLADFDITKLVSQIQNECVFPAADYGKDQSRWGDPSSGDLNYCIGLIGRIEVMLQSPELACIFAPGEMTTFVTTLRAFLEDPDKRILRVSLKYLPSAYNAREIVAHVIGRSLLVAAKEGVFTGRPVIVFLDEAHQFLNKSLGEEHTKYPLDSFELIAKEGRKFSLTICLATQRPRDIPEGVLSQMGTLIVHRLINERDREVVERASGDIDKSAAAFLPTLAPGEAVVVGVDFPIPLTIQVSQPAHKPDSKGPDYQEAWKVPAAARAAG